MKEPNKKPVVPHQPEGWFSITINDQVLKGVKEGGKWTFTCPGWPKLAMGFNGSETAEVIVAEFTTRALAGAVTISGA